MHRGTFSMGSRKLFQGFCSVRPRDGRDSGVKESKPVVTNFGIKAAITIPRKNGEITLITSARVNNARLAPAIEANSHQSRGQHSQ